MKILVINFRDIKHPRAGGAEVHLHEIFSRIAKIHQVTVLSSAFKGAKPQEMHGGYHIIRMGNEFIFNWMVFLKISGLIRQLRPDVIVEDLNKVPCYLPLRIHQKPLVMMHHLWKTSIFKETFWPLAFYVWVQEKMISWFYRGCKFSAVSPSTIKEMQELGIPAETIKLIYNGRSNRNWSELPENQTQTNPETVPYVLWLGRMQKYKGPMEACRAFQKFLIKNPELNFKLIMLGDGPFLTTVKNWVLQNGLEQFIEFKGFVSAEEKWNYLKHSCFLLQTSYKEGWGLTVIEANSCGKTVLGNSAPGLVDSVVHGETGLLYSYNDVDDLALKMDSLIKDLPLRMELEKRALIWASKFSWDKAAEETRVWLEESRLPV